MGNTIIGPFTREAKHYFTLGTMFATWILPAIVSGLWIALGNWWLPGRSEFSPLLIGIFASLAFGYIVPEPAGVKDAGKLRLTQQEIIFGIINGAGVGLTVIALKRFVTW